MIDLRHLENYTENNRIEAKKALGGLPHSVWETYSSFANTLGGIILLGVEEFHDKTLHTVDLPDAEEMAAEFWAMVNDPAVASANVLSAGDVTVEEVDGHHIVVIRVPRAERFYKPVYVGSDPRNAFRRSGEGDYRCTPEEIQTMERDAAAKTQDMRLLCELDMTAFCADSVGDYRQKMRDARPGHVWESLDDEAFLVELGAAAPGKGGKPHPTCAGLLMLGSGCAIPEVYPHYRLEFRDADAALPTPWSGNVFGFYIYACERLAQYLAALRLDDAPVRSAVQEALVNCLVNADYYGKGGVAVTAEGTHLTMANPGHFRINLPRARSGGVSDPRNSAMANMFHLLDVGERTGSGIPNIIRVWHRRGWVAPAVTQTSAPDRTTLTLTFEAAEPGGLPHRADDELAMERQRNTVIEYLTDKVTAGILDIAAQMDGSLTQARKVLDQLVDEGIVVAAGDSGEQTYRLKA